MSSTDTHYDAATGNAKRLFLGSCVALVATGVAMAVVGAAMLALKSQFILTNEEIGWIAGAALWGFAVSQLIFSPLCDRLGFRLILRLAFVAQLFGPILMIAAGGFWMLFAGAWIIAFGNGLVEAACNPLVVALYPNDKTVKLNQFHVWFPGGIVIGSVITWLLVQAGITSWQVQIGLILLPTLMYGVLMLREEFPQTEGVQAGVSFGEMVRATFATPLMWLLLFCMMITASTEVGPNRWIPAVLQAGGLEGILVLAWISGLMAVLRYNAGVFVHKLSPTGLLLVSAIVSAIGLYWFSFAETTAVAFVSATVFAVGVCFFWPTMLGVTSERVPRSGALGLGLMGAIGNLVVGAVTSPWMGHIADLNANDVMPVLQTVSVFEDVVDTFPQLADAAPADLRPEIVQAMQSAQAALTSYQQTNKLPSPETANALRAIGDASTAVQKTGNTEAMENVAAAGAILGPADNYGGRMSFRAIVPFTLLLIVIFAVMYFRDRSRGGYSVNHIQHGQPAEPLSV